MGIFKIHMCYAKISRRGDVQRVVRDDGEYDTVCCAVLIARAAIGNVPDKS